MSALEVSALVKQFGSLRAVDGLDLVADAGEVTAVLGPNGAGKTTTVDICAGLQTADAGTVRVLGLPPTHRDLRHRVGVMPQTPGAYPGARCAEMLELVAAYYADPLPTGALLERLGLTGSARTPFRRLSGGQKQRLSLAMAVVGRPELVFLDEPSAGLDVQARYASWDLVRELRAQGVAIVLTTHAMEEAAELADRVVIVDRGQVLAQGTVAELTSARPALYFRTTAALDLAGLHQRLGGCHVEEIRSGNYVVEGEITPAVAAIVTSWAADQGALTQDLRVGQSLEELFVSLTGAEPRS